MILLRIKRFFYSDSGNFILLTAIILPILIVVAGLAINISDAYSAHKALQYDFDNSLEFFAEDLLEHKSMLTNEIDVFSSIKNRLKIVLKDYFSASDINNIISDLKIYLKYDNKSITVAIDGYYNMPVSVLNAFFTSKRKFIAVPAHSSIKIENYKSNSDSIMMVLDISASMQDKLEDGISTTRIQVLKSSINNLFDILENDSNMIDYIRIGFVAFSHNILKIDNMRWGTIGLRDDINSLKARGYTNSAPAMLIARDMLLSEHEINEHRLKGHKKYKKYVIFVTDGENLVPHKSKDDMDNETIRYCSEIKNTGGEIYVLALAMESQRLHKECASSWYHVFSVKNIDAMYVIFNKIVENIKKSNFYISK